MTTSSPFLFVLRDVETARDTDLQVRARTSGSCRAHACGGKHQSKTPVVYIR
jgi:hypothetical protein